MSDIRNWSKEFLTEFVRIYKDNPCLWKIKDKKVYTNRNLKSFAYEELVKYSKNVYPEANREWVVNRIQSLRGSFRKEFNKWTETRNKSGSSTDSVHIPSLWYYNQLLFTKEQETPEESLSNISDDDNNCDQINVTVTDITDDKLYDEENSTTIQENSKFNPKPYFAAQKKKKIKDDSSIFAKTITQAIQNCKEVDEFEAFGICVAAKLRKMSETQYFLAEPLINTVLSKGLLQTLTPHTKLLDFNGNSQHYWNAPNHETYNSIPTYYDMSTTNVMPTSDLSQTCHNTYTTSDTGSTNTKVTSDIGYSTHNKINSTSNFEGNYNDLVKATLVSTSGVSESKHISTSDIGYSICNMLSSESRLESNHTN